MTIHWHRLTFLLIVLAITGALYGARWLSYWIEVTFTARQSSAIHTALGILGALTVVALILVLP
jgi:hypothetical protein